MTSPSRFQVKIGDEWKDSDASEDKILKELMLDGHETVKITLRGQRLEYDLRALEQRNISRGTVRPIRLPKEWVDQERTAAQSGAMRSGAAAPPPTPRAASPSALAATPETAASFPVQVPITPPPESAPEALGLGAERREETILRTPSVTCGRRPQRESCLPAASSSAEEPRRGPSATRASAEASPAVKRRGRAASLVARVAELEASGCRRRREEHLAARVEELEAEVARKDSEREEALRTAAAASEACLQEVIRATKESGERFAALSLQRLEGLAARTRHLEEQLAVQNGAVGGGDKPPGGRPECKVVDGEKAEALEGRVLTGVPAITGMKEAEERAACGNAAILSDDDPCELVPTQRQNAASQASLLARVLSLEAQLAASQAQNERLRESLARAREDPGAGRPLPGEEPAVSEPEGEPLSPRRLQLEALGEEATDLLRRLHGSSAKSELAKEEGTLVASVLLRPATECGVSPVPKRCLQTQLFRRICLPAWRGYYLSVPKAMLQIFQASEEESNAEPDALEGTPAPPSGESWDWPLTRHERKERAGFLDRQLIMADQRSLMERLEALQGGCMQARREASKVGEAAFLESSLRSPA